MGLDFKSITDQFVDYLRNEKRGGLCELSISRYLLNLRHFHEQAGKHLIELTTYREVSDMIRGISQKRDWSDKTRKNAADTASVFFKWAIRFQYIEKNPMELGHEFSVKKSPQMDFFDWNSADFKKLVYCPNNSVRDNAIFHTLRSAGLRASELCALRYQDPNDIDMEQRWIHVRCGKGSIDRFAPFDQECKLWLSLYLPYIGQHSKRSEVFQNEDFTKPLCADTLYKLVSRKARRLGIKASPHVFRRSLGGEMIARGADISVVQQVLGHKSASTTANYYVHFKKERLRDLYDHSLSRLPVRDPSFPVN